MKRTQSYTIDGKTYDSLEAMPADARRKWDALARLVTTFAADGAAGALQPTTLKVVERLVYGPGESPAAPDFVTEPSARAMLGETRPATADARTRVLSRLIILVLLPALVLASWATLTSVRITMVYKPVWWVAAAALWAGLTAGLAWAGRVGGALQVTFGKLLALAIGMAAISTLAVLGGVPVLLHHLTARPGELVVSVEKKQTAGGRYSCSPRLIIAEFTFPLRDHLCPGSRAFSEVQVGSRLRLEGDVSDFGVRPDVFSWPKPR